MKSALHVLKEVRLAAFELVVVPTVFITTVILLTNKRAAKKVRRNLDIMKGNAYYE